MNPLEALKQKLKVKPIIQERERVAIIIKGEKGARKKEQPRKEEVEEKEKLEEGEEIEEGEEVEKKVKKQKVNESLEEGEISEEIVVKPKLKPTAIVDETYKGFDRDALLKKLKETKMIKVTVKPEIEESEEKKIIEPIQQVIPIKKAKKVQIKQPLIIEDEEEEIVKPEEEIKEKFVEPVSPEEIMIIRKKEKKELQKEGELQEKEAQEVIPIVIPAKKERKTQKMEKGVAILGPETVIQFGDTPLTKRLPKKSPPVLIKVSSYYMNNREIFVNFINSIFEPYRLELQANKENITCENIGKTSSNFSLLTHQKIVRDYMNLYTPYRGLLLYHGLGSGKTCTSIAIAEGMKNSKRIIIMTPASLQANYREELKKCGDLLYKRNQFWEWISITDYPEAVEPISAILNLPREYIRRHGGAFFINVKKKSNYDELSDNSKQILEQQLNEMINYKYTFINYNGLRSTRLSEMTSEFTRNIFDNAVVIIDEAHNLISRIVNKLKKEKTITEDENRKKPGEESKDNIFGEQTPLNLATKLYYMLLRAQNCRIILLSGTPVINYPNEFGILFNILRGYIKTWKIPLNVKTAKKIDKEVLREILIGQKTLDYLDYSPSGKMLTITRNPIGFKNVVKRESGYQGVSNSKKDEAGNTFIDEEIIPDDEFERKIISSLRRNDIDVIPDGIEVKNKKALPDTLDEFTDRYIDYYTKKLQNEDALKRRIIGLSSYFKSAQEGLLPKYDKLLGMDYHIVKIPMSDFQFKIYEEARRQEREVEKNNARKGKQQQQQNDNAMYKEPTSTYRIFSRLYCNFVMPERPTPKIIQMERSLEQMGEMMHFETVYEKLQEQMKPVFDSILNEIEDTKERREWEIKVDRELRSYMEDVIKAKKKGKSASDKKFMKILSDLQKVKEIIMKTKKTQKHNEEEIQNVGKRLEDFDLEQALLESGYNPQEKEVDPGERSNIAALLKEARNEEIKQDLSDGQEGEFEGDEILNKIGGIKYKELLEAAIKNIEDNSNDFLTPEALQVFSPKFLHMLENIKDPDYLGLHLVYSQFRTAEGIGLFSLVLNKNGFTRFKIKKNSLNLWEIDIPEIEQGKPTYALYTGTETSEEKEILRHIYNGEWDQIPDSIGNELRSKYMNNNMGEVIKVFMITSSGSEGINLRNTRYVHIMEPYWHPVRVEQVIGRARRICSHKDLPLALQTVEVFVYIMIFSPQQLESDEAIELKTHDVSRVDFKTVQTSDQYLYEISEVKANLTSQLTDCIKQTAFDCYIYSNGKCVNFGDPTNTKFSYVPGYAEQENETIVKANKVAIEWVGKVIKLNGTEYVYRRMSPTLLNIYDKASYEAALEDSSIIPLQIGTLETLDNGEKKFKLIT